MKLEKFVFNRCRVNIVGWGIKVPKYDGKQIESIGILYPLDNSILNLKSDRGIIARKIGWNDTEFEIIFKEQINKDSIAEKGSYVVYMRY